MIGNTMTATTKTNDNVLSFTEPKVKFSGHQQVNPEDIAYGFNKMTKLFNSQQEMLQIKSLEDITGEELKVLRKFVSEVPIENRFFNPSPTDWMDPSKNETTFDKVYNWWLDMMFVLSQTTPNIAKQFFVPIDVMSNGDEKFKKELKKICSARITKISKKKVAKFADQTLATELAMKLQGQLISNDMWQTIGKNLGNQYVTNHFINIFNLEHLLLAHVISETVVPMFGALMIGENWNEKEASYDDILKKKMIEVGDLATLFGILTLIRVTMADEEFETLVNSKLMNNFFSSEGLNNLKKVLDETPKGGFPLFELKDDC